MLLVLTADYGVMGQPFMRLLLTRGMEGTQPGERSQEEYLNKEFTATTHKKRVCSRVSMITYKIFISVD